MPARVLKAAFISVGLFLLDFSDTDPFIHAVVKPCLRKLLDLRHCGSFNCELSFSDALREHPRIKSKMHKYKIKNAQHPKNTCRMDVATVAKQENE